MKNWRNSVDGTLRPHLEAQIRESSRHKYAYSKAKNKANAQLWVAVANMNKQIFDLNLRMNYLERALQDTLRQKDKGSI